jgi:hypothetical protein
MPDDPLPCVICHETMESHHTVVKPDTCAHMFHAICINVWLARHRSCPICRRVISLETQMPWRTLFATALCITHDTAVERAAYTYAFLSLMLRRFRNKQEWQRACNTIVVASEQFESGTIRLPCLDLESRTTAKVEKQKWAALFRQLANSSPRKDKRVGIARRYILEHLSFMFVGSLSEASSLS